MIELPDRPTPYGEAYHHKTILVRPHDRPTKKQKIELADDIAELTRQKIDIMLSSYVSQTLKRPDVPIPNEVVYLTRSRGIMERDKEGRERVVTLVSSSTLDRLRQERHVNGYIISDEIRRLLGEIGLILPEVKKVVIASRLGPEIKKVSGIGTMFYREDSLELSPVQETEELIYEAVCRANAHIFKQRTHPMEDLFLRVKNSIFAGASVHEHEEGVTEIARLWSQGNGLSRTVIRKIEDERILPTMQIGDHHTVFGVVDEKNEKMLNAFRDMEYSEFSLRELLHEEPDWLFTYLRNYKFRDGNDRKVFLKYLIKTHENKELPR